MHSDFAICELIESNCVRLFIRNTSFTGASLGAEELIHEETTQKQQIQQTAPV